MKWTDSRDIAVELQHVYPLQDPKTVLFTELRQWVLKLPEFTDKPEYCGERVLEAIQLAWIDEYDV